jgi:hypothetical protein
MATAQVSKDDRQLLNVLLSNIVKLPLVPSNHTRLPRVTAQLAALANLSITVAMRLSLAVLLALEVLVHMRSLSNTVSTAPPNPLRV